MRVRAHPGRDEVPLLIAARSHGAAACSLALELGRTDFLDYPIDGRGYPFGLRGQEIPVAARIPAVAGVFDALVSGRPYKSPWPVQQALDHLVRERNRQFDPECVGAFLAQTELVLDTHQEYRAQAV